MRSTTNTLTMALALFAFAVAATLPSTASAAKFVIKVVMVEDQDEDPTAAGKAAAKALKAAMGDTALKAVIMSECFEDREYKEELLAGVCAELPEELVFGAATYGSFTQQGCTDFDAVCLMGIGGPGVQVSARLVKEMGTAKLTFEEDQDLIRERLHAAGEQLASKLKRRDNERLLILLADAHSPKVQYLVEGVQKVVGNDFPITGGCANKNAGQTFVYSRGQIHEDAAIALMLAGDFNVALSGRQANEEQAVIDTAAAGAKEALAQRDAKPVAVLSFNCAGRRSKLGQYEDELTAMQEVLGKSTTLFGCYCAGEIGPVDDPEFPQDILCGGSGWHVMFTTITPTTRPAPTNRASVQGTVLVDGEPAQGAIVTLLNPSSKEAVAKGTTDATGKYTLTTMAGRPKIPAGEYLVTISKATNGNELLPVIYSNIDKTELTITVAAGANRFDFDLALR